jgi:hypothetical protein
MPVSDGESDVDALVRRTLLEKGKIAAIKLYRERKGGVGLAAAKDYVDHLEAAVPPGQRARSKPAGCLGVLAVAIVGFALLAIVCLRR